MIAWRVRCCGIVAGLSACALTACGSSQSLSSGEPKGRFPVSVAVSPFPASQTLSQHSHFVISVTNAGSKAIPNVAVTICNVTCTYPAGPGQGSSSAAFGADINQNGTANPSRPVWIVDSAPGKCSYSCQSGGAGGAVTAYANTWALGRLAPGHTARFDWSVTAVQAGHHTVAWEVAAGLSGRARAVLSGGGGPPRGTVVTDIVTKPEQSYVNNAGQIVSTQ